MYRGGTRLTKHHDDRPLCVATHDRVVHDHEPFSRDRVTERVELEPDPKLADRLAGLDEGPPDVGVLDQPLAVRDAARLRVADRGRRARLGHRDYQVGVRRMLAGKRSPDLQPRGVYAAAGDGGVGPGQVHVLEEATL